MVNTRSRRQTRQPIQAEHPTTLQGLGASQLSDKPGWGGGDGRPTLIERQDQNFLNAILNELTAGSSLQGRMTPGSNEVLQLLQPVHRTFYLALLEVVCNPFALPTLQARLDPERIDSAGLVVRRLAADGRREGWRNQKQTATGTSMRGWVVFENNNEEMLDPDPSHRPRPLCGHPDLESRLLPDATRLNESVSSLFIAPPAVNQATGRTILFGLVPVTSSERSELPQPLPTPTDDETSNAFDQEIINTILPYYLRSSGNETRSFPAGFAGQVLTAADADSSDPALQQAINSLFLLQLKHHLNAFENSALFQELNQISIDANTDQSQQLGSFLQQAYRVLVERQANQQVRLPRQWGLITAEQQRRIVALTRTQLLQRLGELTASEERFEDSDRQYQVRAFVRLRRDDGCPTKIIWSDYSNSFKIAPWYTNTNAPPLRIDLPDVLDPKALQNLRPNVAFRVPPRLFNLLRNDPKDLLKGDDKSGGGLGLSWICGFNIPIITLCAFIVLNLFLQLFNLIFWWIFIIKICIPFPIKKSNS
jgi:hypothetical protein